MYGAPFSTSNCRSIYVKSAVYYKCSLLNFLYTRAFPVGHALETGAAGGPQGSHHSSEPIRKNRWHALRAEASVPGKVRGTLEMLEEKAVNIDFSIQYLFTIHIS